MSSEEEKEAIDKLVEVAKDSIPSQEKRIIESIATYESEYAIKSIGEIMDGAIPSVKRFGNKKIKEIKS